MNGCAYMPESYRPGDLNIVSTCENIQIRIAAHLDTLGVYCCIMFGFGVPPMLGDGRGDWVRPLMDGML